MKQLATYPREKTRLDVHANSCLSESPFLPENETAYRLWRERKLESLRSVNPPGVIPVTNLRRLSAHELGSLALQVQTFNFALFEFDGPDEHWHQDDLAAFGRQLGLHRIDCYPGQESNGITALSAVDASDPRAHYVPYSARALNWHTDGYYNDANSLIGAFTLYCHKQASEGGDNFVLDHEMLYLQIRDAAPDLLLALMDPQMMHIPANIRDGRVIRPAQSGAVFIIDADTGALRMRYSARPRHIEWKSDALSRRALEFMRELINDNEYVFRFKLQNGQGLVCNNLLHGRTAFNDDSNTPDSRLYYRARYYDSLAIPGGLTLDVKPQPDSGAQ